MDRPTRTRAVKTEQLPCTMRCWARTRERREPLEAGAEIDARDKNGWTPLHWAARHAEDPAVIAVLTRAGADPNARDARGATPLHSAAAFSEVPEILEALLAAGADPNAQGIFGWTPLHAATAFKRTGTNVEILVRGAPG